MSKPEWKVTYTDGKVAIRSNNFTHDAVLYLTGDFATHEVAISYASKLVAKLNADLSRIEQETEARVLGMVKALTCIAEGLPSERCSAMAKRALSFQCSDGGHCGDGGYCDECPHRTANEKGLAEGWVRVPRFPTDEMLEAAVKRRHGDATYKNVTRAGLETLEEEEAEVYRAMIQAAETGE